MIGYLFVGLVSLILGNIWGYAAAHQTVATECERLGSFFVEDKTFKCELVEEGSQE